MDWPARSPDLNPIEHVWDALGRRIGARHPSPRTLVELRTALLEEWGLLPLDLLQSLVNSMRARCETLVAGRQTEDRRENFEAMGAVIYIFRDWLQDSTAVSKPRLLSKMTISL
ncbi:hypothetical protein LAZ67_3003938 [Cordylochernes scorpioides]|uniref:Tc1-like transposase DDE domain-containing protein n=1 Tax=Cordylochernes scorpioides TaxID=51811 RepID=A0ABY6KBT9_9ARAC|nr:hypothetical protein LAZ67_3003938 [Cordylochernes scorpioides]